MGGAVAIVGLGLALGALLGLLGGGGAILAVPVLVYVLGVPVGEAIPMSLVVVAATSLVGVAPKVRLGRVHWRLAGVFAATGMPAAVLDSLLGRHVPDNALLAGFALVMIAAGVRMLVSTDQVGSACDVRDPRTGKVAVNWRRCASRAVPAGLGVGVLTGLFGVGGGFLIVPALVLLLGLDMATAVGTSLVVIVANSAAGLAGNLPGADLDWGTTAMFASAAVLAALAAGRWGRRISPERLQKAFAGLVLAVAAAVLAQVGVALVG